MFEYIEIFFPNTAISHVIFPNLLILEKLTRATSENVKKRHNNIRPNASDLLFSGYSVVI